MDSDQVVGIASVAVVLLTPLYVCKRRGNRFCSQLKHTSLHIIRERWQYSDVILLAVKKGSERITEITSIIHCQPQCP